MSDEKQPWLKRHSQSVQSWLQTAAVVATVLAIYMQLETDKELNQRNSTLEYVERFNTGELYKARTTVTRKMADIKQTNDNSTPDDEISEAEIAKRIENQFSDKQKDYIWKVMHFYNEAYWCIDQNICSEQLLGHLKWNVFSHFHWTNSWIGCQERGTSLYSGMKQLALNAEEGLDADPKRSIYEHEASRCESM